MMKASEGGTDFIEGLLLLRHFPLCLFQLLLVSPHEVLRTAGSAPDIVLHISTVT